MHPTLQASYFFNCLQSLEADIVLLEAQVAPPSRRTPTPSKPSPYTNNGSPS